jgi:hypothetical protein
MSAESRSFWLSPLSCLHRKFLVYLLPGCGEDRLGEAFEAGAMIGDEGTVEDAPALGLEFPSDG